MACLELASVTIAPQMYFDECVEVRVNLLHIMRQKLTVTFLKHILKDQAIYLNQDQMQLIRLLLRIISLRAPFMREPVLMKRNTHRLRGLRNDASGDQLTGKAPRPAASANLVTGLKMEESFTDGNDCKQWRLVPISHACSSS